MRRFVKYSLLLLLLGGISGGCSPEDEATDASEPIEIPISFNLLSSGSALTKAYGDVDGKPTKPAVDAREVYVDRVALYVYERKADGVYADNEEGFYLSPDNAGKVLPASVSPLSPSLPPRDVSLCGKTTSIASMP